MNEKGMLDERLRNVERGRENVFEVLESLENAGSKKLVLSSPIIVPERQESPPRAHHFHEINGFVKYLGAFGGEKPLVLVDVKSKRISAVLNEKADKGFEVVFMKPVYHPLVEPWIGLLTESDTYSKTKRSTLALDDFIDFLAVNSGCIIEPIPVELKWVLSQLKASTGTELFKGEVSKGRKESTNGLIVKTKIEGIDDKGIPVEIPEQIKIKVPLFICGEEMDLTFDIVLTVVKEEIVVKIVSSDLEVQTINAFNDMLEQLKTLGENLIITYGRPEYSNWQYVK